VNPACSPAAASFEIASTNDGLSMVPPTLLRGSHWFGAMAVIQITRLVIEITGQ
jgi:hypothetical protein